MYNIILYVFLFIYAFTNFKETPINDMREFMENQQYREDQLRYHCNMGNFMIEPKKKIYETIYNDIKNYINKNINENIYPQLYDTHIKCDTYQEFIKNSHNPYYLNYELEFKNRVFILKNNNPPRWIVEMDDFNFEITDVKLK